MIARAIIFIGLFFCQQVFAQVDSNKVFLASKGNWEYPVSRYLKAETHVGKEAQSDDGITFISDSSYPVKAVFDGEVVFTKEYDDVSMVVTKFGDYFIGYTYLMKSFCKKGDKLKAGDTIGTMSKDWDEHYSLDLIVSLKTEQINPDSWFKK